MPWDQEAEKLLSSDMANFIVCPDYIRNYYDNYPTLGTGWLGVVDKQTEELVGRAGLLSRRDIFNPAELEIAYVINTNHQSKGCGKESAELLMEYVKQNPGIPRVFLGIAPENSASTKIAKSLGLVKEYERLHFHAPHAYYWYRKPGDFPPEQFVDHT